MSAKFVILFAVLLQCIAVLCAQWLRLRNNAPQSGPVPMTGLSRIATVPCIVANLALPPGRASVGIWRMIALGQFGGTVIAIMNLSGTTAVPRTMVVAAICVALLHSLVLTGIVLCMMRFIQFAHSRVNAAAAGSPREIAALLAAAVGLLLTATTVQVFTQAALTIAGTAGQIPHLGTMLAAGTAAVRGAWSALFAGGTPPLLFVDELAFIAAPYYVWLIASAAELMRLTASRLTQAWSYATWRAGQSTEWRVAAATAAVQVLSVLF